MTDRPLEGQVCLVTGAARGIGRATALALAERGADVALFGRSLAGVERAADEARALSSRALAVEADVADWPSVERAVARTLEAFGRVDVLVNNAGTHGQFGYVWELDSQPFRDTLMTNVLGPFHLVRAVVPGMVERRSGVVVNVSSGVAQAATVARSAYATSKAGLDHFSRILAAEAQPFGVRVHVFYPGFVDTPGQAGLRVAPGLPESLRAEFAARKSQGLLQRPESPASGIAWLASPGGAAWPELLLNWADAGHRQRISELDLTATFA